MNKVNLANFFSVVQRFLARWLVESYGRWMLRALWLVVAHALLVHRCTVDFESALTCNSHFYFSAERLNARNSVSYKTLVIATVCTF